MAGQVLDGPERAVGGDGRGQSTAPVAQLADARQLRAGLGQQVDARDPEVGHAVADELDDVVRPHEQDVEVEVLDPRDEAAVVLLEDEAGIVQQPQRGVDHPPLVRDGQPEALGHEPAGPVAVVAPEDAPDLARTAS